MSLYYIQLCRDGAVIEAETRKRIDAARLVAQRFAYRACEANGGLATALAWHARDMFGGFTANNLYYDLGLWNFHVSISSQG